MSRFGQSCWTTRDSWRRRTTLKAAATDRKWCRSETSWRLTAVKRISVHRCQIPVQSPDKVAAPRGTVTVKLLFNIWLLSAMEMIEPFQSAFTPRSDDSAEDRISLYELSELWDLLWTREKKTFEVTNLGGNAHNLHLFLVSMYVKQRGDSSVSTCWSMSDWMFTPVSAFFKMCGQRIFF